MPIRQIAIVTQCYPTITHPNFGTFVEQFVAALAQAGVTCTVIHPVKMQERRLGPLPPMLSSVQYPGVQPVTVLRPRHWSFSARRIGPFNTFWLTQAAFQNAVDRTVAFLQTRPNAVYGHFLYPAGRAAVKLSSHLGVPSFVASGESVAAKGEVLWSIRYFGERAAKRDFQAVTGIVAVSALLKKNLMAQTGVAEERIGVFPNGVDLRRFYPRPRAETRAKYGLPQDKFIVAYVGHFNHRKGVLRLVEACHGLESDVGLLCLGEGPLTPEGHGILYKGKLAHAIVPEFLSAADIFALPTLAEGCNNALLEAMACGLPVVSSTGEFNDGILNDSVSIRVDPLDVKALRTAILTLKTDDRLRSAMARQALVQAGQFAIDERARKVLAWMESARALPA